MKPRKDRRASVCLFCGDDTTYTQPQMTMHAPLQLHRGKGSDQQQSADLSPGQESPLTQGALPMPEEFRRSRESIEEEVRQRRIKRQRQRQRRIRRQRRSARQRQIYGAD